MTSTPPTPQISHPAHSLLLKSHPPTQAAQIFTDKIRNKPLLLHPSLSSSSAPAAATTTTSATTNLKDSRALRRHVRLQKQRYYIQHQRPRPLSAKEKRDLGLLALPLSSSSTARRRRNQRTRRQKQQQQQQQQQGTDAPNDKKDDDEDEDEDDKELNLLNSETIKYETYLPLHRLWTGYVHEVLGLKPQSPPSLSAPTTTTTTTTTTKTKPKPKPPSKTPPSGSRAVIQQQTITPNSHGSLLTSLDYHGMFLTVTRSRDVGLVGLSGIVIRETRGLFVIVSPDRNKVRRIAKRGNVFRVVVDLDLNHNQRGDKDQDQDQDQGVGEGRGEGDGVGEKEGNRRGRKLVFELYGDQIEARPADRATKKFKGHEVKWL